MPQRDTIIVVSSQVSRGAVGNRIIVPVLEQMGFEVWVVPTVLLPYHPGMGKGTRQVPDLTAFEATLNDLLSSGIETVRAVVSGYLGEPGQAAAIARFVSALKQRNEAIHYICDPVIGDRGGLYVPEPTAFAIRDHLVPIADIVTPNRYEHNWLTGQQANGLDDWIKSARLLAPAIQLITSAANPDDTQLGNLWVSPTGVYYCAHKRFAEVPNGTGDIVSALTAASMVQGMSGPNSLAFIAGGVFAIVRATLNSGSDMLDALGSKMPTEINLPVTKLG